MADPKREQLYDLICGNPFLTQQDLADRLGLSRSAVAGHVAVLTRQGRLLGRAYVVPARRPVVCIGGANIDRKLRVAGPVRPGSSNPVQSASESFGGVVRNVAENLARLGLPVQLLTAVGQDSAGRALLDHAARCQIDAGASLVLADALTGSYTAVLLADGAMHLALAHMDLCEQMTPAWLADSRAQRRGAGLVVADLNLPQDTLAELVDEAGRPDAPPLALVAVSEAKMARLPERLAGVRLLVLNRGELAAWAQRRLDSPAAVAQAVGALRAAGVRDVVLTLGAAGLAHTGPDGVLVTLPASPLPPGAVVDVTGAGDALAAGLCHALYRGDVAAHGWSRACRRALNLAALTLQSEATVVPGLGPQTWDELAGPGPLMNNEHEEISR